MPLYSLLTAVVCGENTSSSMDPLVFLKLPMDVGCCEEEVFLGAVTLSVPSFANDEIIDSGLTPEGKENRCSNCLDTKLPPVSVCVSCLARMTSTSPSVLTLNSSGCKAKKNGQKRSFKNPFLQSGITAHVPT